MLTRLEVKGFKNLLDVDVELGPFTCIAGANGIGKSNVFDAVDFLSHTADQTLFEASQHVRGASGIRGSDPRDLFWQGRDGTLSPLSFAVEMLVPEVVVDDLGAETQPTTTFLRYELSIGYEAPTSQGSIGRLVLLREELRHITRGDALQHLRFPHARAFRDAVVRGERRGGPFLSTEERDEGTIVNLHGDGGSRGRPQPRAVSRTARTVLSTLTTSDYPTAVAARQELLSWRRLALEPSALREPDGFAAPRLLNHNGQHLAATLYRIAHQLGETGAADPATTYARVAGRLSDLTGVRVDSIDVELDQVREVFTLLLSERGLRLPARVLSEGTLRFLALCVLLEDPSSSGLICMEEPENGIHPANLGAMLELVQDLAVDTSLPPADDNPLRQVIINTHSPGVVQLCTPADLLLAEVQEVTLPDGSAGRALTLLPYRQTWRTREVQRAFTKADVMPYLAAPRGAQLQLPLDLAG